MATVTKPIALDESLNTTELSSRNVADVLAQELSAVATAIGGIAVPSADHVSYDNSGSGLSATDVQNALDEIVSDIPTVNNGTLTIQQNGTSKGSFTANSASNVNVNIETPTADKKTATDQFTTADGGLLSKCQINLVPVQSGSGDPSPANVRPISGHTEVDLYNVGKNILDLSNVSTETINGITFTVTKNSSGAITEIDAHGTATAEVTKWLLGNNWTYDYCAELPDTLADNTAYSLLISPNDNANAYIQIALKRSNNINIFSWKSVAGSTTQTTPVIDKNSMRWNGWIRIINGTVLNHKKFYPMLYLTSEPDATYEPYLGHLYQVQIGSTVYGGSLDIVSGSGEDAYTNIASYNGETINEPWISSMDVYTEGGTPTTGAQVVYPKTTATAISTTPQQIETLAGQNNLSTPLDGQSIETNGVEYKELFTFADVKEYVDKKIPDAPTTDGTYTLQAVVSGGVPTYSWV